MYILAGNDISKINNTVSTSIKKYSFQPINYSLSEENFSEILGSIETPSLFGERILVIVDITESDTELSEKFIEKTKENKDLYIIYQKKLDSRTKFAKFLQSNKVLIYDSVENTNPFDFGDLVLAQKVKESYEELKLLESKNLEYVSLFNGILNSTRNLMNTYYNTNSKKSIFPNKRNFYQTLIEKYQEAGIKDIYQVLQENDLKLKRGEITDEMLVLRSMNYILNYGNNK